MRYSQLVILQLVAAAGFNQDRQYSGRPKCTGVQEDE